MSTLAIASILEELRCMDGELFKAEICQRLFIWLKSQASETIEPVLSKSPAEYSKVLDAYRSWPSDVAKEELLALQEKAGGAEELQSAWVAVSLHWVRLNKKADGVGKTSIKIKTPDPRDLLKNFFVSLCSKTWCVKGDLWTMDPVKQDFVFREVFRQSVGNSIHFLQETVAVEAAPEEVQKEKKVKQEVLPERGEKLVQELREPEKDEKSVEKRARAMETPENETRGQGARENLRDTEESIGNEKDTTTRAPEEEKQRLVKEPDIVKDVVTHEESSPQKEETEEQESYKPVSREIPVREEDEDDIGPDDSVSQFFSENAKDASAPTFPPMPTPPAKRYADAGTVMYTSAPRRVLVKPITLKLENPVQKIDE
jgi:hypothetical protein